MSVRMRIVAWLVVVMAVALGAVALAVRSILLTGIERDTHLLLEQEAREFQTFAVEGRDPATGRPFERADELLRMHLRRQYASDDEILLGLVRDGAGYRVLRQEREAPYDLAGDRAAVAAIADASGSSGTIQTRAGEVKWAKVRARMPDAAEPGGAFVIAYFVDRDRAEVAHTLRVLGAVSGAALVLAVGVAWGVAGRIVAPVRLLRRTAAEITEQDLTRRIPVRRKDEIGELATTFNDMLDRLERAFATQREFVDDAGHELRTPITIVRGHLEVMGDDPTEQRETLRLVTDELDRMSRIVEELLLLAKAERSDFVRPAPVALMELTSDIYAKVRALGDRRWVLAGIGETLVEVDEQRVTQAMIQLAFNAVQHTEVGAEIKVGSAVSGDRVYFWVSDDGPGIAPEEAERIFERFSRGTTPSSSPDHRPGAGLGLAIVRAIAEGHHGTVRVMSTPGNGATFELDLAQNAAAGPDRERPS